MNLYCINLCYRLIKLIPHVMVICFGVLNSYQYCDASKSTAYCIRGWESKISTYSCLAVRGKEGSWLCPVSILCCWRWSQSGCAGSGPPLAARENDLWGEETGLPFSCSGLCPPWGKQGKCEPCQNLKGPNIDSFFFFFFVNYLRLKLFLIAI